MPFAVQGPYKFVLPDASYPCPRNMRRSRSKGQRNVCIAKCSPGYRYDARRETCVSKRIRPGRSKAISYTLITKKDGRNVYEKPAGYKRCPKNMIRDPKDPDLCIEVGPRGSRKSQTSRKKSDSPRKSRKSRETVREWVTLADGTSGYKLIKKRCGPNTHRSPLDREYCIRGHSKGYRDRTAKAAAILAGLGSRGEIEDAAAALSVLGSRNEIQDAAALLTALSG